MPVPRERWCAGSWPSGRDAAHTMLICTHHHLLIAIGACTRLVYTCVGPFLLQTATTQVARREEGRQRLQAHTVGGVVAPSAWGDAYVLTELERVGNIRPMVYSRGRILNLERELELVVVLVQASGQFLKQVLVFLMLNRVVFNGLPGLLADVVGGVL